MVKTYIASKIYYFKFLSPNKIVSKIKQQNQTELQEEIIEKFIKNFEDLYITTSLT